jgi:hypothetical protein
VRPHQPKKECGRHDDGWMGGWMDGWLLLNGSSAGTTTSEDTDTAAAAAPRNLNQWLYLNAASEMLPDRKPCVCA